MSFKPKSLLCLSLISALTIAFSTPANGANPDDGYPQGVSAPGRTCPNAPVGDVVVSEITQKSLVCTLIDGQKKWWVKGEPLPAATGGSTDKAPEIVYIPKYKLPAKALAKMKVYENVTYANKTATQHLDIYMPKGVVKPPLIVWTHGGGFVIGNDDFMKFDESAKWIQVHTADREGKEDARMAVAIEPMSCPPDAFNSGLDLITLAPNERHSFSLKIKQI